MKPWIQRGLIGLFGASILCGGIAAYAQSRHHSGPLSETEVAQLSQRLVQKVSSELALDAAQQAQLQTLAQAVQKQRTAMMSPKAGEAGAQQSPRETMLQLVSGPQFDRAGAQAMLDAKTAALQAGAPAVLAAFGDFFDSLNPEQQTKLRERLSRGHHHGFGPGFMGRG